MGRAGLITELENRCVDMLADLWNSPEAEAATGCSTLGSSEACMLAGLAFKRRWQARRRADGLDLERPHVDERTIGVVAILGSTMDGSSEPVADVAAMLDDLQAGGGPDVPLHVDAASGGFVAPFLDPDLLWDFRLPRVASVNASGHKYGLVYPGVGWAVWRTNDVLPEDLVFHVNDLGGDLPTYGLNFSRPGAEVVTQYYEALRLGFDGYRRVQQATRDEAMFLAREIAGMEPFELISDGTGIPVFAFRLREGLDAFTVYDVSAHLRRHGWLVPAYTFPEGLEDMAALRVVVRNGFGRELAIKLLEHLRGAVQELGSGAGGGMPRQPAFHH